MSPLTQVQLPLLACFQQGLCLFDHLAVNMLHVMPHGGAPCVISTSTSPAHPEPPMLIF